MRFRRARGGSRPRQPERESGCGTVVPLAGGDGSINDANAGRDRAGDGTSAGGFLSRRQGHLYHRDTRRIVATTDIRSDGGYAILLSAGRYIVDVSDAKGNPLPLQGLRYIIYHNCQRDTPQGGRHHPRRPGDDRLRDRYRHAVKVVQAHPTARAATRPPSVRTLHGRLHVQSSVAAWQVRSTPQNWPHTFPTSQT